MLNSEGKLFALFLCDIKGNRVNDRNRFTLLMSISDRLSGSILFGKKGSCRNKVIKSSYFPDSLRIKEGFVVVVEDRGGVERKSDHPAAVHH